MLRINSVQATSLMMRLRNQIRYFNRKHFNPFALSFAGRPKSFWAVVQHTGRRSGKLYITPIVAVRQNDSFVIPLPYGQSVDWLRNVFTTRSCDLIYQGEVYHAEDPEMISITEGLSAFSERVQGHLRRSDTEHCLRLNKVCIAPNSEALYQSFTATYPLSRGLWILAAFGFLAIGIVRFIRREKCSVCMV